MDKQAKERNSKILTQKTSSYAEGIQEAVVIKNWDLIFLCQRSGNVPNEKGHGLGLYYHNCRYLNVYTLSFGRVKPIQLGLQEEEHFGMVLQLSNPELKRRWRKTIAKETVGVTWNRVIDEQSLCLRDEICIKNYSSSDIAIPIVVEFNCDFEDDLLVRRAASNNEGHKMKPRWQDTSLQFSYEGRDSVWRTLTVHCSRMPDKARGTSLTYKIKIGPRQTNVLGFTLAVGESKSKENNSPVIPYQSLEETAQYYRQKMKQHPGSAASFSSSSSVLNRLMYRSLHDIITLESRLNNEVYVSAGTPWFACLFGRDSIINAFFSLAFAPSNAAGALKLLARLQGQKIDTWTEEQPGRILHELRQGELANLHEIPQTPYYGTVDATPLFLWLLARYVSWTGDVDLLRLLRPAVDRALLWIRNYGDLNRDGHLEYKSTSEHGLVNQGWKDSGNAMVDEKGRRAKPPITLVEAQAYVYAAKSELSALLREIGESEKALELEQQAETLKRNFNHDFWDSEKQFYYMALQSGERPLKVISSNPGHALWANIADPDKAERTVNRLMKDDMFSGWGIRTLSENEVAYNPIGYHLGSVWPHDNAIAVAGFKNYGFDKEAQRVSNGIIDSSSYFDFSRLPELFSGYGRNDHSIPVRYPVACHPQAWAAATPLFILTSLLGLRAEALKHRLHIERPLMPYGVQCIDLKNIRVGSATVDLHFAQTTGEPVRVEVSKVEGELEVMINGSDFQKKVA